MSNPTNLNHLLAEILQNHGLAVVSYNDWLVVNGDLPGLSAAIVGEQQHATGYSVQLDVQAVLDSTTIMIESFGGVGATRDQAVADALANFTANSLHVMLAAFYGRGDDQVTVEQWEIAGSVWHVIIGNYGIRASEQFGELIPEQAFPLIESLIKGLSLDGTIHWVRTYYGHLNAQRLTCEVLLDNEIWETAQEQLESLAWPDAATFYSVRQFLILQRAAS